MAGRYNRVYYPESYPEIFSIWEQYPSAVLFAGGTALLREQGSQTLELPEIILSLDRMDDMHRISRSERFLEIGAMVKLSQIIDLGKTVPAILRSCLENIAGLQLRNMATIGGNICYSGRRLDSAAALTALDAQYELRTSQSSRWISASRFSAMPGFSAIGHQEILSRIRIPLETWDYSAYKKFAGQASMSKVAAFLVRTQKNILSDIRVVYKSDLIWRDKDSESLLIGKHLPLSRRIAAEFVASWDAFISNVGNIGELSHTELTNFIEQNINNLSE